MFRYEFLILVDGENSVLTVDTEGDWFSAVSMVDAEIVKWLCRIDLTPQKALAF